MRVKPIFKYGLIAGALALPATAYPLGLGKLTVDSVRRAAAVGPDRAAFRLEGRTRLAAARSRRSVALPANNLQYQGVLVARAHLARARARRHRLSCASRRPAPVAEPFLDLLVEVNWASGRVVRDYTFLLDPPGSSCAAGRTVTPLRTGAAPAPRDAAAAPPHAPRACAPPRRAGAARPRRHVRSEARRHAVEDRQGIQARNGHARPDAGRAVQEQPERVRRQQHEPPALGRDHHDPECGRGVRRDGSAGGHARSCGCRPPIGAPIAIASPARRRRPTKAAAAPPAVRSARRSKKDTRRASGQRPAARVEGRRGKGAGAAESGAARDAQLREAQSRVAELEKTVKDLQRAVELKNQTMAKLQAQADAAKGKAPPRADADRAAP